MADVQSPNDVSTRCLHDRQPLHIQARNTGDTNPTVATIPTAYPSGWRRCDMDPEADMDSAVLHLIRHTDRPKADLETSGIHPASFHLPRKLLPDMPRCAIPFPCQV